MNAIKYQQLQGVRKFNEPMAKHNSWKIGGHADELYIPSSIDDLSLFLSQQSDDTPITFIGLGSNVLIRDKGIRGVVILMKSGPSNITSNGQRLIVDAGVSCARLSREAVKKQLFALAFLTGIPGTLGGALKMNAGAFGHEIWSFVASAKIIDKHGVITEVDKTKLQIKYRQVSLKKEHWFVQASFDMQLCRVKENGQTIKNLLEKRKLSQPIGLPSCGSVFKNPKGDYAARLIEACGLKGYQIGQAQVSPKHANFIINLGGALACDVEQLIKQIQQEVLKQYNIKLQPEVHFIGQSDA